MATSAQRPVADQQSTWNDARQIAAHRLMTPAERLARAIKLSRTAQRFRDGRRVQGRSE